MLNKSSRKSRKNRIFLLYIPMLLLLSCVGVIVLSAFGMLGGDLSKWNGFATISKLDKTDPDTNTLISIDETEAIEFINEHFVPKNELTSGGKVTGSHRGDYVLVETIPADDSYFEDTLFIGDSRMVGLGMTFQKSKATFYAAVGLSVNQLSTKKVIKVDAETSYTVMEAIENDGREYKRVYMMFGLNELGWSYPSVFIRSVKEAIETLSELCPGAEICIISVNPISVNAKVSIYSGAEANNRIREYNSLLLDLAAEVGCWYLDSNTFFADEDGNLPADFAADGIHMYSEQNKKLMNYIISHAFAS